MTRRPMIGNDARANPAEISSRLGPKRLRQLWRRLRRPAWLGTLRRLTPLSDYWGLERGAPIDRYYIEHFLAKNRQDIHGRVLEVRDSAYTDRFGAGVHQADVLDIQPANPRATIIADLTKADAVEPDQFDCILLTQTLQFIYDTQAAVRHTYRILRPGGVLLATVPSVSRVAPRYGLTGDYWRFTAASCSELFETIFGHDQVSIQSCGNVLTAVGFLAGMAHEELSLTELETHDPYFPLIITIRAVKPGGNYDMRTANATAQRRDFE